MFGNPIGFCRNVIQNVKLIVIHFRKNCDVAKTMESRFFSKIYLNTIQNFNKKNLLQGLDQIKMGPHGKH